MAYDQVGQLDILSRRRLFKTGETKKGWKQGLSAGSLQVILFIIIIIIINIIYQIGTPRMVHKNEGSCWKFNPKKRDPAQ